MSVQRDTDRIRPRAAAATALAISLFLAGCGSRMPLTPAPGATMPPPAYGATVAPTSEALMEPEVQARPERSDEPLRRSEERPADPFDLPPTG